MKHQKTLKKLPMTLGIRPSYKGYHYLISSLEVALKDENALIFHTKSIFPSVAETYHTNARCVERDIRTIIDVCWNSPYRKELLELSPYELTTAPTVGEFLDLLYWHLRKNSEY